MIIPMTYEERVKKSYERRRKREREKRERKKRSKYRGLIPLPGFAKKVRALSKLGNKEKASNTIEGMLTTATLDNMKSRTTGHIHFNVAVDNFDYRKNYFSNRITRNSPIALSRYSIYRGIPLHYTSTDKYGVFAGYSTVKHNDDFIRDVDRRRNDKEQINDRRQKIRQKRLQRYLKYKEAHELIRVHR